LILTIVDLDLVVVDLDLDLEGESKNNEKEMGVAHFIVVRENMNRHPLSFIFHKAQIRHLSFESHFMARLTLLNLRGSYMTLWKILD
jgi:hypothetical protein